MINDSCIFVTLALSSFASGLLLDANGWSMLNWISLVPIVVLLAALAWMARIRRMRAPAVTT